MSELEPYGQSPAELTREFEALPEEVRVAALEYARGLRDDGTGYPQARDQLQEHYAPQFIIVGLGGGTIIFSEHLTEARMARRVEGFDRVPITPDPKGPIARVPRYVTALGVKLEQFEQHLGGDYPSALATLAAEWQRKRDRLRDREWGTPLPPGIT